MPAGLLIANTRANDGFRERCIERDNRLAGNDGCGIGRSYADGPHVINVVFSTDSNNFLIPPTE